MNFAESLHKSLKEMVGQFTSLIALESTDFAPRGWTNQLKNSIKSSHVTDDGENMTSFVTAFARGKDGQDYAFKQHEQKLGHFLPDGNKLPQGFSSVGEGKDIEARYWSGYRKSRKYKYPTKYFIKGYEIANKKYEILLDHAFVQAIRKTTEL